MTRPLALLIATLGSAGLLGGALAFQYLGGLQPCHLCLIERWPHRLAIGLGALALVPLASGAAPFLALLGGLTMAVSAALGLYHAGVEQAWWEGPVTCTSGSIADLATEDLLNQILSAPIVRCDEIAWSLGGISMAGWNGLLSLGLAAVWFLAWRAQARA